MDWVGPVLQALIGKLDPISLVLLILVGLCGYYHVVWRREDRQDREKLIEVINKNNEAVNMLKNVISAALGKPL